MENVKQELADRLKSANNVLISVSRNPSVDQLSALLGLTILLNKQNKHAAAVFSGSIPSTVEFLKPEDIIESNTDSLRDFIIALDKGKADKLRYKVEDDIVRIFITPYKTSISDSDLQFSQGDFNVDLVVALGVTNQGDLDEAITAHGRILHDATVATINIDGQGDLGSINWQVSSASSLSELVAQLSETMGKDLLDEQIATALLTGIVSETQRFSNSKTTAETMAVSAVLMAAGANQQLVATKLEEAHVLKAQNESAENKEQDTHEEDQGTEEVEQTSSDGTLEIEHDPDEEKPKNIDEEENVLPAMELPAPNDNPPIDNQSFVQPPLESLAPPQMDFPGPSDRLMPPPNMGQVSSDPSMPPLPPAMASPAQDGFLMGDGASPPPSPPQLTPDALTPPPPNWTPVDAGPVITNPDVVLAEIKGSNSKLLTEPPTLRSGPLTANIEQNVLEPATDPLSPGGIPQAPSLTDPEPSKPEEAQSEAQETQMDNSPTPPPPPLPELPTDQPEVPVMMPPLEPTELTPPPVVEATPAEQPKPAEEPKSDSLNDIEKRIKEASAASHQGEHHSDGGDNKDLNELTIDDSGNLSTFAEQEASPKPIEETPVADQARDEINKALESVPVTPETPEPPIEALNAQPMGPELHEEPPTDQPQPPAPSNTESTAPPVPPPITF